MTDRLLGDSHPIAVVGLGCVFPGAADVETFWRNVVGGVDAVTPAPADRCDPALFAAALAGAGVPGDTPPAGGAPVVLRGGFLPGEALWVDPARYGVMPVAAEGCEPDQMLALATAAAALDDAGGLSGVARERVGVILGRGGYVGPGLVRLEQRVRTAHQLVACLRTLLPDLDDDRLAEIREAFCAEVGAAPPEAAIGLVPNLAASRIANRLDLGGPAYTVDAACASALVAVDAAVGELRSGRCDLVLAGGVHHCHDVTLWSVFAELGALSPSGAIRPFAAGADGIVVGEGTGVVVLERLADAERRGHEPYAVLRGCGVASDGRDASMMSPRVDGQVLALERAYREAGVDPGTVGLVEGHGTATPAGDRAELDTLRRVFGKSEDGRPPGALGSVKSMIGHAMPAAGAAGLIKAVLAVHHGVLPPTLHAEDPHPAVDETRFRLLAAAAPWEPEPGTARRAGVNAFGFGGINAHVVVEEHAAGSRSRGRPSRPAVVTVGLDTEPGPAPAAAPDFRFDALLLAGSDTRDLAAQLRRAVDGPRPWPPALPPPDAGPVRLAVVDPDPGRLELAARSLARQRPLRGLRDVWFAPEGLVTTGGRVAFAFPGVESTADTDLTAVARWFGRCLPSAPAGSPALEARGRHIFAAGRLLHGVLGDLGVGPDDVVGHSLGEWTGAFCAELIPGERADEFLAGLEPGSLEVPGVVYLALGCGADQAAEVIAGLPDVAISHDNCPHQSVVCGSPEGIAATRSRLAQLQILARELPFRSGFHSPAFAPYLDPVRRHWERMPLQPPGVPLWSATTCGPYPDDPDEIRRLAAQHLVEPVRFRELVERLHADGVRLFVQLGVGSLCAFVDDTLRGRPHVTVPVHTARRPGLPQLARAAVALWVEGVPVDFEPLLAPTRPAPASAPREAAAPSRARTPASPRRPRPAPAPALGPRVRLDLGAPLVRLPDGARLGQVRVPAAAGHGTNGVSDDPGALQLAHDALVTEALAAARDVRTALAKRGGRGTPPAAPAAPAAETRRLRLSLDAMPWLVDHSFYRQAPGWPEPADLFPVVPMTAMVELLAEAALRLAPGKVVAGVQDVRALRWLPVAPATEVTVRASRVGPDRVHAALEGYARATVLLADRYPAAPAPAAPPLTEPAPSPRDARQLYDEHWMFHGPAYQSVHRLGDVGSDGIDGVVEALPSPGATVDAAGQLLGWWIMATSGRDFLALPQSIARVELFGPLPRPGSRLPASVRITDVGHRTVRGDVEIVHDGRVLVRITGWTDRRFDSDAPLWRMLRDPEHRPLATVAPAGFAVVDERWPDGASRDLIARRYLGAAERATYQALNPRAQRHWLLGRIAAKDAVRRALWAGGHGPLFPAEVPLAGDAHGRLHVADGPAAGVQLSIAHTSWVGVALCASADAAPVGVDIAPIEPRSPQAAAIALTGAERSRLPDGDADEWITRAWAAKEAAVKAAGATAGGRPGGLPLRAVDGEHLLVGDRWIATTRVANPVQTAWGAIDDSVPSPQDGGPAERKDYIIAWTDGDRTA